MNHLAKEVSAEVVELIHRYGFDLSGYSANALVDYWLQHYPAPWIRLATIEALYQGRYKAISIEQILNLWRRRTRAVYHFNSEFERMISLRPMLSAATASSVQSEIRAASADSAANGDRSIPLSQTPPIAAPNSEKSSQQFSLDATANNFPNDTIDSGEIRRTATSEPLPIDQFTPMLETSDFYWRLKAVIQAMETSPAEEIGRRN